MIKKRRLYKTTKMITKKKAVNRMTKKVVQLL